MIFVLFVWAAVFAFFYDAMVLGVSFFGLVLVVFPDGCKQWAFLFHANLSVFFIYGRTRLLLSCLGDTLLVEPNLRTTTLFFLFYLQQAIIVFSSRKLHFFATVIITVAKGFIFFNIYSFPLSLLTLSSSSHSSLWHLSSPWKKKMRVSHLYDISVISHLY